MTKLNTSPEAIAKRKKLALALKTNLAKRKSLAKQHATRALADQNNATLKKSEPDTD